MIAMRGQKLWIRAVTPDDLGALEAFYAREDISAPVAFDGLLAKLAGGIVAHASWTTGNRTLRLDHLYVAAELRRKRIGRGLLAEIERSAARLQCTSVVVGSDCPAGGFLLARGYEIRENRIVKVIDTSG
jgi:GNAT superfamily N-acetyltransferase